MPQSRKESQCHNGCLVSQWHNAGLVRLYTMSWLKYFSYREARRIVQDSLEAKHGQGSCICQKAHINGFSTALGMEGNSARLPSCSRCEQPASTEIKKRN